MQYQAICCAACQKDGKLIKTLTQIRLGIWVCELCVKKYKR